METKIGERLARLRVEHGMTQEEFANRIGISRQAVSKYELDKSYPDLDKIVSIANLFGVSTDYLLLGEQEPAASDEDLSAAMEETRIPDIIQSSGTDSTETSQGKERRNLYIAAIVTGALFLFFATLFLSMLFRNAWNKQDENRVYAQVEQVYAQYTKADVCFVDDDLKQVQRTVWLDENGIRAGDYVICYTNEEQDAIYADYYAKSLLVPGIMTGVILLLLILIWMEIRKTKESKL